MAKNRRSIIAIVGGVIILVSVALSIFIKELGWWNLLTVLGDDVTYTDVFTTPFFGDNDTYFNAELTYLLPGIIAGIGGILCLFGNKYLSITGGLVAITGMIVFMIFLGDSWVGDLAELAGKGALWGGILVWKWRLGIGFFITGGGALLAILGGALAPKK